MDKASRKYYDKNSYSEEEKMNTEMNYDISVKILIIKMMINIILNKKDQKLNKEKTFIIFIFLNIIIF